MAMKTIICLSFIVLNNFFANVCEKKIVPHQPKTSLQVTGEDPRCRRLGVWGRSPQRSKILHLLQN